MRATELLQSPMQAHNSGATNSSLSSAPYKPLCAATDACTNVAPAPRGPFTLKQQLLLHNFGAPMSHRHPSAVNHACADHHMLRCIVHLSPAAISSGSAGSTTPHRLPLTPITAPLVY